MTKNMGRLKTLGISAYIQPDEIGRGITIYVDPNDSKKYYVDAEAYK